MRTQMTVRQHSTGALIDDARQWHAIDWQRAQREVRRLQMRIAKAVKEGKPGKVKALQWLHVRLAMSTLMSLVNSGECSDGDMLISPMAGRLSGIGPPPGKDRYSLS